MRNKRTCCGTMAGCEHMPGCHSVDALIRMMLKGCKNAPTELCEVCRERYCPTCFAAHAHLSKTA